MAIVPVPGRPRRDRRRGHLWWPRGRGMIDPDHVARPTKRTPRSTASLFEEAESLRTPAVVVSFAPPRPEPVARSAASCSPLPFARLPPGLSRVARPANSMADMKRLSRFCLNLESPRSDLIPCHPPWPSRSPVQGPRGPLLYVIVPCNHRLPDC